MADHAVPDNTRHGCASGTPSDCVVVPPVHPPLAAAAIETLGGTNDDAGSSARVLVDALKSELNFYRNFFWRHQEALRRSVEDDPELSASLNNALVAGGGPGAEADGGAAAERIGVEAPAMRGAVCNKTKDVFEHNTYSVGYEVQLAEGRCRSLDEEAVTLHEHYRGRISQMHEMLRDEQEKRSCVLTENNALREANHALCREVQRLHCGCNDLRDMHVNRLHQLFVVVNETLWRARLENEALRYLTLRAMDAQARSTPSSSAPVQQQVPTTLPCFPVGAKASLPAQQQQQQLTEPAPTATLIPSAVAVLNSTSSHHRMSQAVHRVFESYFPSTRCGSSSEWTSVAQCESEFAFVARELRHRLQLLSMVAAPVQQTQQGTPPRTHAARRGLARRDEALVALCTDHLQRPAVPDSHMVKGQPTAEAPPRADAYTDGGPDGGGALVEHAPDGVDTPYAAVDGKAQVQNNLVAVSQNEAQRVVLSSDHHEQRQPTCFNSQSGNSSNSITTHSAAHALVTTFHDPLAKLRSSMAQDAFVRPGPVASDARALRDFLLARARGQQSRGSSSNLQLLEGVEATADRLDPMVKALQKLRAEVLSLRREKDEVTQRADALEQQLRATRTAALSNKRRSVEVAMRGLTNASTSLENGHRRDVERQQEDHTPRRGAAVPVAARTQAQEEVPEGKRSISGTAEEASPLPKKGSVSLELSQRVVDRVSEAAMDLKEFERIARKSADPALRGRMMRQMKELHEEVSNLIGGASSSSRAAGSSTATTAEPLAVQV